MQIFCLVVTVLFALLLEWPHNAWFVAGMAWTQTFRWLEGNGPHRGEGS